MDLKTEMISYLEKKIKGCDELEMEFEKWAFIQCLLEVRKLCDSQKPTSEPDKALDLLGVIQWVSVTDKLPDENCDVLVVKKNGKVFQMSYHAPFDSTKRIFQWWGFGEWVDQHRQISHWMYLPKPPIV